ncbi:hypothetical protein M9H77_07237 [Catharanthus roseus]|uniref:Uncharacterized protein n=1 Tax=Catharanthus roseus TaxID=4058 RepID=A0ACC0BUL6_CATRO|nr:hypothetical protein M9H77_07237 [Catharanthus roseus]
MARHSVTQELPRTLGLTLQSAIDYSQGSLELKKEEQSKASNWVSDQILDIQQKSSFAPSQSCLFPELDLGPSSSFYISPSISVFYPPRFLGFPNLSNFLFVKKKFMDYFGSNSFEQFHINR